MTTCPLAESRTAVYVFAPMTYSGSHARKHSMVAAAAALGHRAVYVEPPNSHSHYTGDGKPPRLNRPGISTVAADSMHVLATPKKWGIGNLRFGWSRRVMEPVQRTWVTAALAADGRPGEYTIGIVTSARWEPLLRNVEFDAVVYDKNDEPDVLRGWLSTRSYTKQERALMCRADLLVSPSHALLDAGRRVRPEVPVHLVRNGVESGVFERHAGASVPELEGVHTPVIGFVGTLAPWVDVRLIADCARAYPDVYVAVVGTVPSRADVSSLQALPNVHLWGRVSFERIPAIMNRLDVCLLPFRDGPISESACPVKFFEYLSLGKPVVSTPMPELEEYLPLFAMTRDGYVDAVGAALREDDPALRERRRTFGRAHGWDRLFAELLDQLAIAVGSAEESVAGVADAVKGASP